MAVRIRMKRMGRRHRPFFRICAMDARTPRDGRAIEELGTYDPMIRDTDARVKLNGERIDYWLSVGAQPSENVRALIKKYGTDGTRLKEQEAAMERLAIERRRAIVAAPVEAESTPETAAEAEAPAEAQAPAEAEAVAVAEAEPEASAEPAEPPQEKPAEEAPEKASE